jgi:hypothetical protein
MNGSDWPSPSVNLSMVDEHIKKIVAATGVDVPRLVTGAGSCYHFLPLLQPTCQFSWRVLY